MAGVCELGFTEASSLPGPGVPSNHLHPQEGFCSSRPPTPPPSTLQSPCFTAKGQELERVGLGREATSQIILLGTHSEHVPCLHM